MTPLLLGLVCIVGAIVLGVYLIAGAPATADNGKVAADRRRGSKPAIAAPAAGQIGREDSLPPIMRRLRALAGRLTPADYARRLQRRLDLAGNPPRWPAERVMAFKGVGLVLGALGGIVWGLKHGPLLMLAVGAAAGAFGFFIPDILVRNVGEKRQIELRKGLPDALDMMVVCVESGLGFDAAVARVALNLEGPISTEFARVLQEMQFGKSRTEALRGLVERTDVSEIRTFVSALIQSTELGISIGVVLRELAKEMRIKRRQRAEEQAQKVPVKILLPLITCLLPAMFVVILGPAMINIFHTLAGLNH
jgi:tight adherence protein C